MQTLNKRAPGRRKKVFFNKGRQVDQTSLKEANKLLNKFFPLKKDMLIEYLHLFNDKYNALFPKHMRALSELMKLSMSEIYEVASFYAHFHIVNEDSITVPEVTIKVCDSITCTMNDAEKLYHNTKLKYKNFRVEKAPCMGRCNYAPVIEVNHNHILHADNAKVAKAISEKNFAYKNEKWAKQAEIVLQKMTTIFLDDTTIYRVVYNHNKKEGCLEDYAWFIAAMIKMGSIHCSGHYFEKAINHSRAEYNTRLFKQNIFRICKKDINWISYKVRKIYLCRKSCKE